MKHLIAGWLAPTPRGSNPIRSNRWASGLLPICWAVSTAVPVPDAPGPPGLISSEPIRCAGTVAFFRSTAIFATAPSGLP